MARIRIVDEWLRSPVSAASRSRAIMVVSSSWSEQRVLMRAFASSLDQTRPTIVLHGVELAIGPAGTDPHSEWGIHVEPPIDGRAQELREQLELAAKRLAGSKGNPPRLADEVAPFETKATNLWAPGTPRATPSAEHQRAQPYEPNDPAARAPIAAEPDSKTMMGESRAVPFSAPAASHQANKGGGFRSTPAPIHRSELAARSAKHAARASGARSGTISPVAPAVAAAPAPSSSRRVGRSTVIGFDSVVGAKPPQASAGTSRSLPRQSLAHLVGHTMPLGFNLTSEEREVLNALGKGRVLSASEVGQIAKVGDGIGWMEALIGKLSDHGLDLVEPGDDNGGEPTYVLRR